MIGEVLIKNVRISPNLVLAPMAGVTDSSFRRLIKELNGVGLIVTEFISVEGLTRGNMRTHRMMKFLPEERPLSIQIFGYDVERMAAAAGAVPEATGAVAARLDQRRERRARLREVTEQYRARLATIRQEQIDPAARQQAVREALAWYREQRRAVLAGEEPPGP